MRPPHDPRSASPAAPAGMSVVVAVLVACCLSATLLASLI
jgi:hypothetical protein